MFKRVEKRRRKLEEEEELGIDGEMKEVLGMHDTDSDESDSSSDGESEEGEGEGEVLGEEEAVLDASEDDEDDEEEGVADGPAMSLTEALEDPLYIVSIDPDVKACVVCPGKLLKNATMEEIHKASSAHERRFAKFVDFAGKAFPDTDIRDFYKAIKSVSAPKEQAENGKLSKRQEKRKEKMASIKAKRESIKRIKARRREKKEAKAKMSGEAAPTSTAAESPKKKRRKVEDDTSAAKEPESPVKPQPRPLKQTQTRIAKKPPSKPVAGKVKPLKGKAPRAVDR